MLGDADLAKRCRAGAAKLRAVKQDPCGAKSAAALKSYLDKQVQSGVLTPAERATLAPSCLCMTAELAVRFLTDYLNGDIYYYIYYLGQNLDRARTQLKLAEDMLEKLPEIQKILRKILSDLNIAVPSDPAENQKETIV